MLFNSMEFAVFFAVVFGLYFLIPPKRRWLLLLVASYIFYMAWNWKCVALILTTTLTAFGAARAIAAQRRPWLRRLTLAGCLAINLGLLGIFKYLGFFTTSINDVLQAVGSEAVVPVYKLVLPVGISFYTFQALSYTLDVYFGNTKPEPHLGRFALYVSFFPQLVAGPIERSRDLLPQFQRTTGLEFERVRTGLRLALWGIFKKVCIADLVAPVVKNVYGAPENYNGTILSLATILFAIQIYCDFSGYSDVAIGVARMLGFDLTTNFRQPYFSTSLADFWRRWHISLSNWFRDYVYVPLGGNRRRTLLWCRNIMIVFLLSGLWHGAAWTFVSWGALHGIWLLVEYGVRKLCGRHPRLQQFGRTGTGKLLRWLTTTAVILVSWVFFVSPSLQDAQHVLTHFWRLGPLQYDTIAILGLPNLSILILLMQLAILFAVDAVWWFRPQPILRLWKRQWLRMAVYVFMIFNIGMFGVFKRIDFIYFQF